MAAKDNFFTNNEDIQFHVTKRIDMSEMFELTTNEEKEALSITTAQDYEKTWLDILNTLGEYAGTTLVANQDAVSKSHLTLDANREVVFPKELQENLATFIEIGGPAMGIEPKHGGIGGGGWPLMTVQELFGRACPSTNLTVAWFGSIADIVNSFATQELKDEYIPKIASGEFSGSMALTEPDAGSDLASIRSYAEKQADGTWAVYGTKQFISNGNGQVCLVLAKNKKSGKSLKDINLYLVPRVLNGKQNFQIVKLEEKAGLHGSATCALEFNGSKGYLMGKDGDGFSYMLKLMNEARVGVSFQSLGIMEASYRLAVEFADQRKAFGKPIAKHELIAEKLLNMEVDIRALRSISYQAARYLTIIGLGERKLNEPGLSPEQADKIKKRIRYVSARMRQWTPLVKWWGGERSVQIARDALQVHGGYGFTTEYKPEWLLRESLIFSLYEGTSQIQALMCMKDTLKEIIKRPNQFVELALGTHWRALGEKDPLRKQVYTMTKKFNSALITIIKSLIKGNMPDQDEDHKSDLIMMIKALSKGFSEFQNMTPALLHAERIIEMKSIIVMSRSLLWDAKVDPNRRWIAEHFINRYYPVILKNKKEIENPSQVLLKRLKG